jgi:septal ring factor EnvC (AmiA/AmiB activator)
MRFVSCILSNICSIYFKKYVSFCPPFIFPLQARPFSSAGVDEIKMEQNKLDRAEHVLQVQMEQLQAQRAKLREDRQKLQQEAQEAQAHLVKQTNRSEPTFAYDPKAVEASDRHLSRALFQAEEQLKEVASVFQDRAERQPQMGVRSQPPVDGPSPRRGLVPTTMSSPIKKEVRNSGLFFFLCFV